MNLDMFVNFIFSFRLIPRIRGGVNGLRYKHSSCHTYIYGQLLFTGENIIVKKGVIIYKNCRIEGVKSYMSCRYNPLIILNERVTIQQNCHITCAEKIYIGANTAIAAGVTITDIDHSYTNIHIPIERQSLEITPVKIGNDCKIYNNAVILRGTSIGNHCVVGANSVVKGDYPDYSIIVGCPARIVKRYNLKTNCWEATFPDGTFLSHSEHHKK